MSELSKKQPLRFTAVALKPVPWILFFVFLVVLPFFTGCTKKTEEAGTTIHFVTWKPNIPEAWEEVLGLFKSEHPDIQVVREVGPHSSTAFHDLLTQKLKNRSDVVDVFLMDVIWPPEFGAAGWAMPLNDLFTTAEQKKFRDGTVLEDYFVGG